MSQTTSSLEPTLIANDLGALVHEVVNSSAAIRLAASALRAGGTLSAPDLAEVTRMEQAAGMVIDTVTTFASATRSLAAAPSEERPVDLYLVCCELAERRRVLDGLAIYCRAFGDSRGPWNHEEIVDVISTMIDSTLICLDKDPRMTIAVTGLGRHARVDVHGIGWLSAKKRQSCLAMPSTISGPRGAMLTVTASRTAGTIFTLRLPR